MKKRYKAIFAAMIGNALEYYDVMLYGFFATLLAPVFFPTTSHTISIISSLGTFAAGFVMRPLGGILFGHLGDKFGRRYALVLAIFLVTIPTFTIGILPTYATIGIAAPIILVVCRLLQGLCVGGEYSGASIFVIEYAKKGRESFAGGILCAAGFFGGILGTFIGFICTLPLMPSWGWRIPFLIGSVIGLIGFYIRTQVGESPEFIQHQNEAIEKVPLMAVLRMRKRNLLCTMGIGATSLIPFYMASVYMGYLLSSKLTLPTSSIMLINVALNVFVMILLPLMGSLADRVGKAKLMIWVASLSIFLAYPLFSILEKDLSLLNVILVQGVLALITAGFGAPSIALLATFFPVHERYSGVGFGYALGGALLGGTTPLILASLVKWSGSSVAPAFYLMFSGLLGVVCVMCARIEFFTPLGAARSLQLSSRQDRPSPSRI
jgi:MHS family proline/betaine transporter-like MFS transporter